MSQNSTVYFAPVDKSRMRAISNINKGIDAYLVPLGIKLDQAAKKSKAGLAENATGISREQALSYEFIPFPQEELERDLVLVAPRKVTAFEPANIKPVKEKKKRASTGAAGTAPRTAKSKASRVHEMEQAAHFVKEDSADSAVPGAMARKIARSSSAAAMVGPAEQVMTSTEVKVPKNFYEVINNVFTKFWTMEFTEAVVNQAFFANIDKSNAKDYGLTSYAENPMSLGVIRDRIIATQEVERLGGHAAASSHSNKEARAAMVKSYKSVEDFSSDFTMMFKNISMYFPADNTVVHSKSKELEADFKATWDAAQKTLKWR